MVIRRCLEHCVVVGRFIRHGLEHVPMLDDFSIVVEAKDIDAGPFLLTVARPLLATMEYNVIALKIHRSLLVAVESIIHRSPFLACRRHQWIVCFIHLNMVAANVCSPQAADTCTNLQIKAPRRKFTIASILSKSE
jgi:hypothetical protein